MYRSESVPAVPRPRLDDWQLWLCALVWFGIGDVATTAVGLQVPGVVEAHPLAARSFERTVVGTVVGLKTMAFGGCYVLWRWTPRPYRVGVPLGLILLGASLTVWNTVILLAAVG